MASPGLQNLIPTPNVSLAILASGTNPDGTTFVLNTSGGIAPGSGSPVELEVSSATAASANNVTLAGAAGKTTYITGFEITGNGATAASQIAVTITGLANTLNYSLAIPVIAAGTNIPPLIVQFTRPIPASAINTAIVVNVPSFGAGNTAAAVNAHGFQL